MKTLVKLRLKLIFLVLVISLLSIAILQTVFFTLAATYWDIGIAIFFGIALPFAIKDAYYTYRVYVQLKREESSIGR